MQRRTKDGARTSKPRIHRQTESDEIAEHVGPTYYRRARGDMIEVYKYLHGQYKVEEVPLLLDEIRVTRGHSGRLKKERVETIETKEKSFPA